ncbi:CorA family divalent cation transporter [Pseudorhodoplanes sp.]|uniref:CorA family divalent cation transporter n=1 Tax=Pseudorhodoplanes sp. TaxID=1934341 RepID=UPI003D0C55DA
MNRLAQPPVDSTPAAGIISAFHFDSEGEARALRPQDLDEALQNPEGFVWVHLSRADIRCRHWIDQHAPLSEIVREIMLGDEDHQRIEIYGREIVGVIPELHLEFDHPTEDLTRLRFAMTSRLLVTMRRIPLRSVENVRRAITAGTLFTAPIELLDAIIDHFADVIGRLAERIGDDLDLVEERIAHSPRGDESQLIARARSDSVRVHRQLTQMRGLFHRLELRVTGPMPELAAPVQSLAQKIDDFDHSVSAIHDRARLLQEELAGRMAELTNRRLLTLSILTAGILPPTLVTGFFGMNTRDLPFLETPGGTWYALALAAGAGALTYWAIQRMRAL